MCLDCSFQIGRCLLAVLIRTASLHGLVQAPIWCFRILKYWYAVGLQEQGHVLAIALLSKLSLGSLLRLELVFERGHSFVTSFGVGAAAGA